MKEKWPGIAARPTSSRDSRMSPEGNGWGLLGAAPEGRGYGNSPSHEQYDNRPRRPQRESVHGAHALIAWIRYQIADLSGAKRISKFPALSVRDQKVPEHPHAGDIL